MKRKRTTEDCIVCDGTGKLKYPPKPHEMAGEYTQKLLYSHMAGDRSIDMDDIEYLLEKEQ